MGLDADERDGQLAERERAAAEAGRLLAEARVALRAADRERIRARKLAGRIARRLHHTLAAARTQLAAERSEMESRVAKFNAVQSEFHTASATDRDRQRAAWADLTARRQRLAAEWEEASRFQAEQAAALDARAAELAVREKAEADARASVQREVAALREEAAALDARARNARLLVDELELRRAELRAEALAPAASGAEPPAELRVALDRGADRDLGALAAELTEREARLDLERATMQTLVARAAADQTALADRRRVLAEQFAQLAAARAQWHEAERGTLAEMERLASTLRRRETELDAREHRLVRADGRRREDAYELWQLRLRLEAWQSKIVAYEMQWYTERERREVRPAGTDETEEVPLALPVEEDGGLAATAELVALRAELERMATVLLEAELPEPLDSPERELPWGAEEVPAATTQANDSDADVLLFGSSARAA